MLKFFRNPVVLALIVGAAVLAAAPPADAGFRVRLTTSSGATADLFDTDGDGIIFAAGTLGNFDFIVTSSLSKPNFPNSANVANIHQTLQVLKNNTVDDNLFVTATDTDFSLSDFGGLPAVMTSSAVGSQPLAGQSTFQSWYSATNNEFALDVTAGPHAVPGGNSAFIGSGTNPFSLTNRISVFTGTSQTSGSIDADTNITTPEPGTIVLLCTAVPGFVFAGYRRYRRKAVV